MENDNLDSPGSVVKPPSVAARSFSEPVGLVKINPKKANPNVLGRDALSVVNAQSLTSSTTRSVDTRLVEVSLQHIRQEEELKLKLKEVAEANIIVLSDVALL